MPSNMTCQQLASCLLGNPGFFRSLSRVPLWEVQLKGSLTTLLFFPNGHTLKKWVGCVFGTLSGHSGHGEELLYCFLPTTPWNQNDPRISSRILWQQMFLGRCQCRICTLKVYDLLTTVIYDCISAIYTASCQMLKPIHGSFQILQNINGQTLNIEITYVKLQTANI